MVVEDMCLFVCVCVECLIGKQKKPILFKVTEPSSIPYRPPSACAKWRRTRTGGGGGLFVFRAQPGIPSLNY